MDIVQFVIDGQSTADAMAAILNQREARGALFISLSAASGGANMVSLADEMPPAGTSLKVVSGGATAAGTLICTNPAYCDGTLTSVSVYRV